VPQADSVQSLLEDIPSIVYVSPEEFENSDMI
jgi:hypothetical protein